MSQDCSEAVIEVSLAHSSVEWYCALGSSGLSGLLKGRVSGRQAAVTLKLLHWLSTFSSNPTLVIRLFSEDGHSGSHTENQVLHSSSCANLFKQTTNDLYLF